MSSITLSSAKLYLPIGRQSLRSLLRRPSRSDDPRFLEESGARYCKVLDGISVEVKAGDRIGLIGPNGAGKSSLLRVMAGIYAPTSGDVQINGRVSTLFAPNIGMSDNASGLENIYISARTLGMSRAQISAVTDGIVRFADLGEFIDLPLRTYSAGMKMRLGFAIATAVEPDILLIDEVFGAGDAAFRERAKKRMASLMERAGVMVLATHSDGAIMNFCNRLLWLDNGKVVFDGPAEAGIEKFRASIKRS